MHDEDRLSDVLRVPLQLLAGPDGFDGSTDGGLTRVDEGVLPRPLGHLLQGRGGETTVKILWRSKTTSTM